MGSSVNFILFFVCVNAMYQFKSLESSILD